MDSLVTLSFVLTPFILGSLLEQNWLLKLSVLGMFFSLLYILFRDAVGKWGRGKAKKGLQVLNIETDEPCTLLGSFVRNIVIFIPLLNIFDLILILDDKKGQRIGDKIMHLQVVEIGEVSKKPYEITTIVKEVQEKVSVNNDSEEEVFSCGNCDREIIRNQKVCPHCGAEIDWEM